MQVVYFGGNLTMYKAARRSEWGPRHLREGLTFVHHGLRVAGECGGVLIPQHF